jgi:hypothetical protein
LHPSLFSSPKKSFHLPNYANAMAHASITDLATGTPNAIPRFVGDHRILQYLDLSAVEGDVVEGLSGDDQLSSSSHSTLGSTSSSQPQIFIMN